MSLTNEVLVNRIRSVRKSRGISQIEMAKLLDISKSTYNRIELGDTPIYDDRLNEILKILKISLFEIIFTFENNMNDIIEQKEIDLSILHDLIQDQIKQNQKILKILNSKIHHN
jgi:transcriptional regulator with XRE-family HTH domain